jgi:serralysin
MSTCCFDRYLPGESPYEVAQQGPAEGKKAAALRNKLWEPAGRTLRIRFLDGDPVVQQKVIRFAQEWSQHANIHFDFGDHAMAEIRITFQLPGSWSFIGTDALGVPAEEPTMNFGWLTRGTPNDEVRRVVLHEFGHALGLIHEHQNPAAAIPWNRAAVYEYYAGPPNNWSQAQVEVNLFETYEAELTQHSVFDSQSIMLYPIPQEFTEGGFRVGWNQTLSALDKAYIAAWYPFPESKSPNSSKIIPR